MSKLSGRNTLLSMAGATAGVFLFAFSFCVFLRPLGLYSGGFTGIAQIIHLVFQDILKIPLPGGIDWTGIIFWMLNIPLFLLSYVLISHSFFYKTIEMCIRDSRKAPDKSSCCHIPDSQRCPLPA